MRRGAKCCQMNSQQLLFLRQEEVVGYFDWDELRFSQVVLISPVFAQVTHDLKFFSKDFRIFNLVSIRPKFVD